MADPKRIILGSDHSGIGIEFIKRRKVIAVWGWYDTFVGISGQEIPLSEFFEKLGIKNETTSTKRKRLSTVPR